MLEIAVLIIPHLKTNCCKNWSGEDFDDDMKKIDEIKADLKRCYVAAKSNIWLHYGLMPDVLNKTVLSFLRDE